MRRKSHAWKVLLFVNLVVSMLVVLLAATYPIDRLGSGFAYARPVIFTGMTVIWAGTFYAGYVDLKSARVSRSSEERPESYWDYFVAKPSNWAAIIVGASLLSLGSFARLSFTAAASPNAPYGASVVGWLGNFGFLFMAYGLYLGVILSLHEYRKAGILDSARAVFSSQSVSR